MSNLADRAGELEVEIRQLYEKEREVEDREKICQNEEEKIRHQNIVLSKERGDLIIYQQSIKKLEAELLERQKQVVIKEKSIAAVTDTLTNKLITIKKQELELKISQERFEREQKEFTLRKEEVDRQKVLNEKEREIDILRKSKIALKEKQIETELTRIKKVTM